MHPPQTALMLMNRAATKDPKSHIRDADMVFIKGRITVTGHFHVDRLFDVIENQDMHGLQPTCR